MKTPKSVVMFSSGISSWAAAKVWADRNGGPDGMVLLFADTLIEDEDNYRFLTQAADNIGAELVTVADGRTPGGVMRDERFIGNTRVDPCSKILKRQLLDKWRNKHCTPDTPIILGIGWDEINRMDRILARVTGWNYVQMASNK